MRNNRELVKSVIIAGIGVYAIYWAYTQPCVATQEVAGQVMEIGGSTAKLICMSADYKLFLASLIGSVATWSGLSGVFKHV